MVLNDHYRTENVLVKAKLMVPLKSNTHYKHYRQLTQGANNTFSSCVEEDNDKLQGLTYSDPTSFFTTLHRAIQTNLLRIAIT